MKQITENINIKGIQYNRENVSTGNSNYLYNHLKSSFHKALKIDIIVSFLMESGVKLLINELRKAVNNNIPIRILTGNYLKITQPSALYLIKGEFKDKIDIRFYNVANKSFHPKSYIFHGENESSIYIGSSNISKGALTDSIEWNYRLLKSQNEEDFNEFCNTFEDLFNNHSIKITDEVLDSYSKSWTRPNIYKDIEKDRIEGITNIFEPRGAQIEALYSLNNLREDGLDKGIVVAATGIGKTYLAAFDSKEYKKVLFVAHREEIIKQAAESFKNVRGKDESIGFFYNNIKDTDKNVIFALVQTLGKDQYLNEKYFKKDYFDYIVVDEFHHAVSSNYTKILNYFKPKFLLGITATPERLDSKDVFKLCDYNIAYEVRLKEAINKGWLVSFRYYGIYDDTVDYSKINVVKGKYDNKELEEALMLNKRGNLILKHYKKYNSKRALGFCSSKKHAEYMAKYFSENGIKAKAVYSGESGEFSEERNKAISELTKGNIQVLFSVDMFNEGLDIPSIDLVMFLRPTESPTIFLQQLGRGLRKSKGKEYLNVLDFIGNYKKANLLPFLLSGKDYNKNSSKRDNPMDYEYPDDCMVDFDFRMIDIFKTLAEKEMKIEDRVKNEYFDIKDRLGHRPSRVELFTEMDSEIYENIRSKSKLNPFNNYLEFLYKNNELNDEEINFYNTIGREFINMIETTSMSKTYKMPVLLAFYNNGNIKMNVSEDDISKSFKEFYEKGSNKIDMLRHKSTRNFESWGKDEFVKLAKDNPVKFLMKTHNNFFCQNNGYVISLRDNIKSVISNKILAKEMKDAIEFRTIKYYKERKLK